MRLTLAKIAEFISATGEFASAEVVRSYSIDSRTVGPGQLFFAVKGERLDGHDFVEQALERGAAAAVVRTDQLGRYPGDARLLAVEDTLVALQTLAPAVRKLGGKPLMLLKLEPEYDVAVIEMGMSHAGEIRALAKIAQPEIGVVTNVAAVHLEFFDSLAGIARAKYELIESLPASGTAVLNSDDEYVSQFGRDFKGKVVLYGTRVTADVRAENVQSKGAEGTEFDVTIGSFREHAKLPLVGEHNVLNALAAVGVGVERGLKAAEAVGALTTLAAADKRGQVLQVGNITVINDCYNSNPKALHAMVEALAAMKAGRRIVVAGEMLELGPAGEQMHRAAGQHIAEKKIDVLVGVRGLAQAMVDGARHAGTQAEFVAAPEEAGEWLAREARDGDVVLLKASRGVKLEKALEKWKVLRDSSR